MLSPLRLELRENDMVCNHAARQGLETFQGHKEGMMKPVNYVDQKLVFRAAQLDRYRIKFVRFGPGICLSDKDRTYLHLYYGNARLHTTRNRLLRLFPVRYFLS